MTHEEICTWLQINKAGSRWNLSGDISEQSDLDSNLVWLDESGKPTLSDLGL